MVRLLGLLALAIAVLTSPAARHPAWAHAQLLSSDPIAGAVLPQAPESVRLMFNEPVSPLLIRWLDPKDKPLTFGAPISRDGGLEIPAPSSLPAGTHLITARVISLDGHAVSVSLTFSIGQPSRRTETTEVAALPIAALTAGVARAVFVFMLAWVVGGALFVTLLAPRPRGPAGPGGVRTAAGIGLGAAMVACVAQGADLMGTTLSEAAINPVPWLAALHSSLGASLGLGLAAMGVALVTLRLTGWISGVTAITALGLGAASMAATGHAASARPPLTLITVGLHGAALIVWIGALPSLAHAAGQGGGEAVRLMRRFSPIGIACVVILLASGLIQGAIQVETPVAMITQPYGSVLLAKLALVCGMIGLAVRHRFHFTPALARGEVGAAGRFRGSIRLELAVAALLVLVTGGFRATPPPRAELAADRLGVSLHLHQLEAMVDLTLVPGRAGPNAARMMLMSGEFGPLDARGVRLTLARPDLDLALPPIEATRGADGLWHVDRLDLPRGGAWQVTARVLVTDFKAVDISGTLELRR